jgi:nicotinate-nucleotide adenylyltransferase
MDVGLFGGTFDPPHIGHLELARFVRSRVALDQIVLVPAPAPPHKQGTIATYLDRLEMTRRLVDGVEGLAVSDVEAQLPAPHYTVQTLRHLRKTTLAGFRIHLIIGADSLDELHQWHSYKDLFDLAHLVAVSRPGYQLSSPHLEPELLSQVQLLDGFEYPVASRDLRAFLMAGGTPDEVPGRVMEYIRLRRLYQ